MFVIKFESWPRGITTAHEIGRCFVMPVDKGYRVNIEYLGDRENNPIAEEFTVETESTNIVHVLQLALKQRENNT